MGLLPAIQISLLLIVLHTHPASSVPVSQKYAPVVGRWRIELKIDRTSESLEFETDGNGVYGLGTGYFVFVSPEESRPREYPAAWSNIDPQRINITAEMILPDKGASHPGTLLLRTVLAAGKDIKGEAIFIDEAFKSHRGSFTMKRLLSPEELKR